jgi:hypothetical protein
MWLGVHEHYEDEHMGQSNGKFLAIEEGEDGKETIVQSSKVVFRHGKFPSWFKKMSRTETGDRGFNYDWMDHIGQITGTETFVSQPYHIDLKETVEISELCQKYHLRSRISGMSSWYPGRTLSIFLHPTDATYSLLKLKKPAVKEQK